MQLKLHCRIQKEGRNIRDKCYKCYVLHIWKYQSQKLRGALYSWTSTSEKSDFKDLKLIKEFERERPHRKFNDVKTCRFSARTSSVELQALRRFRYSPFLTT